MPRGLYFLKALFKGLIFGRAYIRRGLGTEGNLRFTIDWASLWWKRNLPFLLCFTLYSRANSKYKSSGGLYSEGHYNGGFFALRFWGTYIWRGSRMEGLIFGILRYKISCRLCFFSLPVKKHKKLMPWNDLRTQPKMVLTCDDRLCPSKDKSGK